MSRIIDLPKFFASIGYSPHPSQWLFHNSKSRFRVAVCGRRFGKSTMAARDLEPELFLRPHRGNRRWYWIVGPCVDTETEIFTQDGWKRYHEVQEGDRTLTVNPETGLGEWNTIEKVLVQPGEREVISMQGHTFSAVATPDHRWLTKRRPGAKGSNRPRLPKALESIKHLLPDTGDCWTWRTTETLTADDRIPKAVPHSDLPQTPKYTDEFVELVAWIYTEGSVSQRQNSFVIHQSNRVNPKNVDMIRRALVRSDTPHHEYTDERGMTHFGLNGAASDELWQAFEGSHKIVRPGFVEQLTRAQLQLFVDISVLADGHNGEQRWVAQKEQRGLVALQLACQLIGIPTSLYHSEDKDVWRLALLTQTFANPIRARYNAGHEGMKVERTTTDTVWCVTTKNGNWFAKRAGTTYYTSNTYDLGEKEFRVLWDDLIINKGLGEEKRVKRSYNKRSGAMYIEMPWGTRVEVRSASHPDTLVGEGLDGVIMSEAAKHQRETWERYIRASLGDKIGWATFPTTPEGRNWLYDLWLYGQNNKYAGRYDSWRFPSWLNPYVFPEGEDDPEIALLRDTTGKDWFEQEIAALFTSYVGKIFQEFDEQVHCDNVPFDPSLPNYIAFDWGFVNPLAAIEFQVDGSDRIRVWREHYKSYWTLEQHLIHLKQREQPEGYRLDGAFGDAEDPEAAAYVSQHLIGCLALPEAKQNWRQGVDLIKSFLRPRQEGYDKYDRPIERPGLTIDFSCTDLIREMGNYRGRAGTQYKSPADLPQKLDDHGVDALRYGLMHLFELGAKHHLSEVMRPANMPRTTSDADEFVPESFFSLASADFMTSDQRF